MNARRRMTSPPEAISRATLRPGTPDAGHLASLRGLLVFLLGTAMMSAAALCAEWQRERLAPTAGADPRPARGAAGPSPRAPANPLPANGGRPPAPGSWGESASRGDPIGPRGATNVAVEAPLGRAAFLQEPDGESPVRPRTRADARAEPAPRSAEEGAGLTFRNTYYHVAEEGSGAKSAVLFDAACAPLAAVPKGFHDDVCVQGSGRLVSGEVVSFAARGCACATVCPGTGQQICFERLDAAQFPHGRGARGTAVVPLRTVAVDTDVLPLGATLFIPEMVGLPTADGGEHDGCFVAEDRGIQIKGHHIDIFTGTKAMMSRWNAAYPSNKGVHVVVGSPRCAARDDGASPRSRRTIARR